MKFGIEVFDPGTLPYTERVQLRFLMTAEAIGVNQLENTNLLFVRIRRGACGNAAAGKKALIAGNVFKLFADGRVDNVTALVAIDTGKLVEIAAPLFGNGVGVCQVGFKKLFNIGEISTLEVGSLP